ncbi:MAG: RNA polymerase sigma factor [Gammaproteobacteria bacterium]|nr:RNA polymerase sigma factor [Gammaproteobacteria bacterium]
MEAISHRRLSKALVNHHVSLFRLAFSWCHDKTLAEDLAQQTLCKALERGHQLRSLSLIRPWLFQILARCFADYCRRRSLDCCSDDIGSGVYDPEILFGRVARVQRVRSAIGKLSLPQRQVLTLVELEGLTYREVADTLEVPIGTVMSRLSRARKALRNELLETEHMAQDANVVPFKVCDA